VERLNEFFLNPG
jgi:hypothetical protein